MRPFEEEFIGEFQGITDDRYAEFYEGTVEERAEGAEEIMGEVIRLRNLLYYIKGAHYAMLGWAIGKEISPESNVEENTMRRVWLMENDIGVSQHTHDEYFEGDE